MEQRWPTLIKVPKSRANFIQKVLLTVKFMKNFNDFVDLSRNWRFVEDLEALSEASKAEGWPSL